MGSTWGRHLGRAKALRQEGKSPQAGSFGCEGSGHQGGWTRNNKLESYH